MVKIAIVGSRKISAIQRIKNIFSKAQNDYEDNVVLVSGGALGIDTEAETIAKEMKIKTEIYHADWKQHGKAAGPIRNKTIVEQADMIYAMWDGKSRGTLSTINLAIEAQKPLMIVNYKRSLITYYNFDNGKYQIVIQKPQEIEQ